MAMLARALDADKATRSRKGRCSIDSTIVP
jgi:hypothetical protein